MKRLIGLPAVFAAGLLVGISIPFATAHDASECPKCPECVCPPCGDETPMVLLPTESAAEEDHPQHVDEEDEEAIKKALEAIERAETQMQQVQQPELPDEFEE